MRLLFIRHAEPDYVHDSLTEKGFREAKFLGEYLKNENIDEIYVSPLGRAQETMKAYLRESGTKVAPVTKDWLREFDAKVKHDHTDGCAWDFLPETIETMDEDIFSSDPNKVNQANPCYQNSNYLERYNRAINGLDEILKENGYVREGRHYKVEQENTKTIAFFCHFGVISVLTSHLFNTSSMVVGQYFCALPSSITTLFSEERRKGIASFRCVEFGATPHLAIHHEAPSFSARFSETYSDPRRHD